jgi:hypothetical protein
MESEENEKGGSQIRQGRVKFVERKDPTTNWKSTHLRVVAVPVPRFAQERYAGRFKYHEYRSFLCPFVPLAATYEIVLSSYEEHVVGTYTLFHA